MNKVKIVAEIGCNHNGSIDIAKILLQEAKVAGVDYAKFQMFKTESLVTEKAELADYQKNNVDELSQTEMLRKLELSTEDYLELIRYAREIGIGIFATPFDIDTVDFLASVGQNIWKIPSGEITNLPLLEKITNIKCEEKCIVLSTGMATMKEINDAVKVLSRCKNSRRIILQCNTQYPTLDEDMNLLVIKTFSELYKDWDIGLSDHSNDILASIAAVGMGAVFIEKHFTLDKNMEGPDHKASITPNEMKELCTSIRRVETIMGNPNKQISKSEQGNIIAARKSIVAKKVISKGDIFTEDNLTCKRPGSGISPMEWYNFIGKTATRDYIKDDMIE